MAQHRLWIVALCLLIPPSLAHGTANEFEGVLRSRQIKVPPALVATLLAAEDRGNADKVFAIPDERIRGLVGAGGAQAIDSTAYIRGGMVRVDAALPGNREPVYLIVDTRKDSAFRVFPGKRQIVEMTPEDRDATARKAEAAQRAFQAAPIAPEQKSKLQSLFSPPPVEVRPLGRTEKINGREASAFRISAGRLSALGWVTREPKALAEVVAGMQETVLRNTPAANIDPNAALTRLGVPLRVQILGADGSYELKEMVEIKSQPVDPELFALDPSFQRTRGSKTIGGDKAR